MHQGVVYFDQQTGSWHGNHWSKSSFWYFDIFFHKKWKEEEKAHKKYTKGVYQHLGATL